MHCCRAAPGVNDRSLASDLCGPLAATSFQAPYSPTAYALCPASRNRRPSSRAACSGRAPLNLFSHAVERFQRTGDSLNYDLYDGHIFSPDKKKGIVIITSPFGSSETAQNSKLLKRLLLFLAANMYIVAIFNYGLSRFFAIFATRLW